MCQFRFGGISSFQYLFMCNNIFFFPYAQVGNNTYCKNLHAHMICYDALLYRAHPYCIGANNFN